MSRVCRTISSHPNRATVFNRTNKKTLTSARLGQIRYSINPEKQHHHSNTERNRAVFTHPSVLQSVGSCALSGRWPTCFPSAAYGFTEKKQQLHAKMLPSNVSGLKLNRQCTVKKKSVHMLVRFSYQTSCLRQSNDRWPRTAGQWWARSLGGSRLLSAGCPLTGWRPEERRE